MHLCIDHKKMSYRICNGLESGSLSVRHLIDSSISTQFKQCVEEQIGKRLIKQPNVRVHTDLYGSEHPLHIKGLSKAGYQTWYPNIKFSVCIGDNLVIRDVSIEGFGQCIYTGNDSTWLHEGKTFMQFTHKVKQLKTQINHVIRIHGVRIPCSVFEQVLKEVRGSKIVQPFVANLNACGGIHEFALVTFEHVVTGERLFCSCNKDVHEQMLNEIRFEISNPSPDRGLYVYGNGNFRDAVIDTLEQGRYEDNMCHLCIAQRYGTEQSLLQYGNGIKSIYDPYVNVLMRRDDLDYKTARKEVRAKLGLSKWTREDKLYDLVQNLFDDEKVLREASPEWLGRLRLDIYLPRLSLAIEYMGEQHYHPVKLFGGEEGFRKTVERDKLKQKYCEDNGVTLVHVRYDHALSEASLRHRLNRWLRIT